MKGFLYAALAVGGFILPGTIANRLDLQYDHDTQEKTEWYTDSRGSLTPSSTDLNLQQTSTTWTSSPSSTGQSRATSKSKMLTGDRFGVSGTLVTISQSQSSRPKHSSGSSIGTPVTIYKGTVTFYGYKKPSGRPYEGSGMNGGGKFHQNDPTIVAVPVRGKTKGGRNLPIVPYGTRLKITIPNGRSIEVICRDTCVAGTWDLSASGMKALGFKSPNQKIRNATVEKL